MPKRIPIVAANWKMYKTGAEAQEFLTQIEGKIPSSVKVFIAPPFTALPVMKPQGTVLGGQNMHEAEEGAFTGEISARMLKAAGAQFVLLGHSERRRLFHETDQLIHQKLQKAVSSQLLPILCIGETLEERQAKKTFDVLSTQLETALSGISPTEIVLAYEPVWAIGTGQTATPKIAEEAHQFCRSFLKKFWGEESAAKISILYGGSVTPETAPALAQQPDIDGALVGGSSLDAAKFIQIIQGFAL
ncbi:MAG TPA: triose-phosphate isomerase [Rhabdochlamydiaceae bacterium]|jgi:triosephosphate isomerase|nr:triose-phosphate isomerase [Rhabdochlamydiaceae bacterium]